MSLSRVTHSGDRGLRGVDQAGIWVRRQKGQVKSQVQHCCISYMAFAGDFSSQSLSFLICKMGW